jgi:urease accessory protein
MDADAGAPMAPERLLRLIAWLSPSFPTGGFSYSHGLEYAVEAGLVRDRAGLERWVGAILEHGAGRSDAMLFAAAHRAVEREDEAGFVWAVERADVMRATSETALESSAQGRAFLTTVRAAWPGPELERWMRLVEGTRRPPAHPVAVAVATATGGIALFPALIAYLHAVAANLVSAGIRLVPLGQTDGQRAIAALEPVALRAAQAACAAPIEDLGGRAPLVDWTSLSHEMQYTRLFRS